MPRNAQCMKRLSILIHFRKVQPLREARAEFSQLMVLLYFLHSNPQEIDSLITGTKQQKLHCHILNFQTLLEKQNYLEQAEMSDVKILPCFLSFFLSYRQLQDHWRTTKGHQTLWGFTLRSSEVSPRTGRSPTTCLSSNTLYKANIRSTIRQMLIIRH